MLVCHYDLLYQFYPGASLDPLYLLRALLCTQFTNRSYTHNVRYLLHLMILTLPYELVTQCPICVK